MVRPPSVRAGLFVGSRALRCRSSSAAWLVHDAEVEALQPMIPPTQHVLQEADLRAGQGQMRVRWAHGPISPFRGLRAAPETRRRWYSRRSSRRPRTRTLIAVVLAHRTVPPLVVASLMAQPELENSGRSALRHIASDRRPARIRRHMAPKKNAAQPNPEVAWCRPCSARRRRSVVVEQIVTTAFSAAAGAATRSPLKPPQRCPSFRPRRCTTAGPPAAMISGGVVLFPAAYCRTAGVWICRYSLYDPTPA